MFSKALDSNRKREGEQTNDSLSCEAPVGSNFVAPWFLKDRDKEAEEHAGKVEERSGDRGLLWETVKHIC